MLRFCLLASQKRLTCCSVYSLHSDIITENEDKREAVQCSQCPLMNSTILSCLSPNQLPQREDLALALFVPASHTSSRSHLFSIDIH
jgi:hypothetical protein